MDPEVELQHAYSELGEAAASLSFAGYPRLSNRVRDLQSEVGDYL